MIHLKLKTKRNIQLNKINEADKINRMYKVFIQVFLSYQKKIVLISIALTIT